MSIIIFLKNQMICFESVTSMCDEWTLANYSLSVSTLTVLFDDITDDHIIIMLIQNHNMWEKAISFFIEIISGESNRCKWSNTTPHSYFQRYWYIFTFEPLVWNEFD